MTGEAIRRRRRKLKLRQADLARRLGVDVNTVARWERDERLAPPFLGLAFDQIDDTAR